MHVTHDETRLRLRVVEMRWEAEGVLSLAFAALDGSPLPAWSPGAHLDLHLPNGLVRQYSMCGTAGDPEQWRIAVLHEAAGRGGSAAVHRLVRPGDIVEVVGPRNDFALVESPSYVFVAGGIGITALLPMLDVAQARGCRWRLVYGGRSRRSMAFVDQLQERYGTSVEVCPQDEVGLLDLDAVLGGPQDDTVVYCCGPEPLLAAVEQICAQRWPAGVLHVERFAAKPDAGQGGRDEEFELVLDRSGRSMTVEPGQSVLDALEAAGVYAVSSCRDGVCGTCEVTVISGVPDHRDSVLSDDEQAANDTMMICVGRSRTPQLVLDL